MEFKDREMLRRGILSLGDKFRGDSGRFAVDVTGSGRLGGGLRESSFASLSDCGLTANDGVVDREAQETNQDGNFTSTLRRMVGGEKTKT